MKHTHLNKITYQYSNICGTCKAIKLFCRYIQSHVIID